MRRFRSPPTIQAALKAAEARLEKCGALRPLRHSELLLEAVLEVDRTQLYLRLQEQLGDIELRRLEELIIKR